MSNMVSRPASFCCWFLPVILLAPLASFSASDTTKLPPGVGPMVDIRKHELTPGIFFSLPYGRYRLDGPYLNITVITEDCYNNNKMNVSAFGLINYLIISLAGFFHPPEVGKTASTVISGIVLVPSIILNSQHHFKLIKLPFSQGKKEIGLSLFCGTKTDYYPAWSAGRTKWFRFSYALGAEARLIGARAEHTSSRSSFSIQSGIAWPHDYIVSDDTEQEDHRDRGWFIAFKYVRHIGN